MEPAPTTGQLLEVWEKGRFQTTAQRALSLLALAAPAEPDGNLAHYGIGRRDQELLGLHNRIFGPRITAATQCPACGQPVELDLPVNEIRRQAAPAEQPWHTLHAGGYELRFRLPNCGDLAQLTDNGDDDANRIGLLECCVSEARLNGESITPRSLPEEATATLSRRMAELDPLGDIQLALTCPSCAHGWQSPLDIASFLWSELHSWAARMLREIHLLASAYGWSEADILALSPRRRQAYLEMIQP